jgi:hypothetical protein
VAAHYEALVGCRITVGGGGVGSSVTSGTSDTASWLSVVDSWAGGNPARPRPLVLAARTEDGYSATVVLFRGADDDLTHIAVTLSER